jgi:hypothetical protein
MTAESLCRCGHPQCAHEGHAHAAGTPEPTHCSRDCGCGCFRPRPGVGYSNIILAPDPRRLDLRRQNRSLVWEALCRFTPPPRVE